MNYLVSGATGFIGRELCRDLSGVGSVRALSRSGGDLAGGLTSHPVDLGVVGVADELLRDIDVVFHLAGIAHTRADPAAYQSLNREGTLRLAHQAAAAGARCFVFLSSVKAMGVPLDGEPRSEGDVQLPRDPYGLSKWQAERDLLEEFAGGPMSVVIIRPALVYGEGVKGNLRQLEWAVRHGLPRPPGGGARSMLALEDLVALLCRIAQDPPRESHTWITCEPQGYTTQSIYDLMRSALGQGQGVGWLPRWGWRAAARLLDLRGGEPAGSTYRRLFGAELYSSAAVTADTGWRPRLRLQDVIARGLAQ